MWQRGTTLTKLQNSGQCDRKTAQTHGKGEVGTGSPGHVVDPRPPLTYSLTASQKGGVETLINMLYDRWARLRNRVEHTLLPCFGLSAMF